MRSWKYLFLISLFIVMAPWCFAEDWAPISPEEMQMTSIPEQPGAPAVILLHEETDDDMKNFHSFYIRMKILTEAGRKYADIEQPYNRRYFNLSDVSGRTVHADGTIIPFEGKPFDKLAIKGKNTKIHVKTFSLTDVQIGSIIDFRYTLRYDDHRLIPPNWEVQTDLFQKAATFKYYPFQNKGNMYITIDHDQIA